VLNEKIATGEMNVKINFEGRFGRYPAQDFNLMERIDSSDQFISSTTLENSTIF
jgi:hypothetical protein